MYTFPPLTWTRAKPSDAVCDRLLQQKRCRVLCHNFLFCFHPFSVSLLLCVRLCRHSPFISSARPPILRLPSPSVLPSPASLCQNPPSPRFMVGLPRMRLVGLSLLALHASWTVGGGLFSRKKHNFKAGRLLDVDNRPFCGCLFAS